MVEGEWRRQRIRREEADPARIIAGDRFATRLGHVDRRHRVAAGVTGRIGIETEQRAQGHFEPRLLARLADRRLLDPLPHVDESPGERPARRRIAPLDQYDGSLRPIPQFDDDVGGQQWGDGSCHR